MQALINALKPLSGILGGALGGPAGAAVLPVVVAGLADAFGLGSDATPEDVVQEIESRPQNEVAAVVQQVEARAGKTIEEIEAAVIEAVNQTARLELQSESKFVKFARPFNIWIIGTVTGGYGACLIAATAQAVFFANSQALNLLVTNAGVLGIALAPCGAVAGLTAWGRTKEKVAGAQNVVTGLVKAVAGGKR